MLYQNTKLYVDTIVHYVHYDYLFCSGGKTFKTGYFSGLVVGPPMLDNVDCEGTEANLIYCAGVAWAPRSCSNNSLAGCKCD